MDTYMQLIPIILVCLIVLFLVFFKSKNTIILHFLQRAVLGFICIVVGNYVFKYFSIDLSVGINPITILAAALLGLPGTVGLYFLSFYL